MAQRHDLRGRMQRDRISQNTTVGGFTEMLQEAKPPPKREKEQEALPPPKRSLGVKEPQQHAMKIEKKMVPLKNQKEGPPLKAYKSVKLK